MNIDGVLMAQRLDEVSDAARRMDADGDDGVFTFEGPHDRFLPLMLAAQITARYGAIVDRVAFNAPYAVEPALWNRVLAGFREP